MTPAKSKEPPKRSCPSQATTPRARSRQAAPARSREPRGDKGRRAGGNPVSEARQQGTGDHEDGGKHGGTEERTHKEGNWRHH